MKFKEAKKDPNITFIGGDSKMNPIMPEPEVGKIYHGFEGPFYGDGRDDWAEVDETTAVRL